MFRLRILTILLALISVGCGAAPSHRSDNTTNAASRIQVPTESETTETSICDLLAEIRALPYDPPSEKGVDVAFDSLIEAGEKAIPCLIHRVTDLSVMKDPRMSPKYRDFRMGDMAYIVLVRATDIEFTEFLPKDVQERFNREGVQAYFKYVDEPANRKRLQDRLYEWYRKKYGKDAREQP